MERWSFTMDADGYTTIFRNGAEVWCGTYGAFMADGDIKPPVKLQNKIHDRYEAMNGLSDDDACRESERDYLDARSEQ